MAKLIQVTDLHLGETPQSVLAGIRPLDSFKAVLNAINDFGRGDDLLLLSGDLSGTSSAESYTMLNQLLQDYSKQAVWLPGNHDNVELMKKHLVSYPPCPVSELGNWGILTLDSSQSGTPVGHIRDEELRLVDDRLNQLTGKPILVTMHHCPIALGCQWLDKQRVNNPDGLYDLLASHDDVKLVVTGHVHQQYDGLWRNLPLYTTPSSCIQFKQHSNDFAISDQPPGYRWFDLGDNGVVKTGVEFVANFDQYPDTDNAGY